MAGGDRDKALDAALANIERQFGKGSVMRLGDETRAPLEVIPTGAIALDVDRARAGIGLVLILRWYWWRVPPWSEIAAMPAKSRKWPGGFRSHMSTKGMAPCSISTPAAK